MKGSCLRRRRPTARWWQCHKWRLPSAKKYCTNEQERPCPAASAQLKARLDGHYSATSHADDTRTAGRQQRRALLHCDQVSFARPNVLQTLLAARIKPVNREGLESLGLCIHDWSGLSWRPDGPGNIAASRCLKTCGPISYRSWEISIIRRSLAYGYGHRQGGSDSRAGMVGTPLYSGVTLLCLSTCSTFCL